MKERGILFSGQMVRAILDGRKTQTRRAMKPQAVDVVTFLGADDQPTGEFGLCGSFARVSDKHVRCPYGALGDRLWVRETWRVYGGREYEYQQERRSVIYRESAHVVDYLQAEWRPSIFMPRWASRLTLEVTGVRVERLHDITEADAQAEGMRRTPRGWCSDAGQPVSISARRAYEDLWHALNAKRGLGWDTNPWVWVIEFKKFHEERNER